MNHFEPIDDAQLSTVNGGAGIFSYLLQSGLIGALQGGIGGLAQGAMDVIQQLVPMLFGQQQQQQQQIDPQQYALAQQQQEQQATE